MDKTVFSLMMASQLLLSCSDSSHTSVEQQSPFSLSFRVTAGDQDISCDQAISGLGTASTTARLLDFRFFVSDLVFLRADGSEERASLDSNDWQAQDVALLDFQNKDDNCSGGEKPTHSLISGHVANPQGIVGLRFKLGLPSALNHADPALVPSALNETSMFWTWQSGYKFMRIDVAPEGGILRPSDPDFLGNDYFFHLGSTGCSGDPARGEAVTCERVNQAEISLNGFVWDKSTVKLDLAKLLEDLNLKTDDSEAPGCMSGVADGECASYFEKLGLDFTLGTSGSSQTVFSLE